MINVEMDVRSAAAVRQALFESQNKFTYNPTCVPQRINQIREVITEIDKQIENELKNETTDA